ncbi:hypothetical protein BDK51DRAFT_45389 [Blyttiomyces helicus]|uniref:Uncharacterized protein n=1 Tax=Blyttiomyces helicus TaxID=388810 RepID=A0A4P9W3B1_9FUNG|nr:hypothetical protein BDK51DRAFT_45389 [Blyttiomyces helicus]|eukprot:RKO85258.1 hypothetical protein BDK51DRAFT_45389 [Blyttiomyces helicus]
MHPIALCGGALLIYRVIKLSPTDITRRADLTVFGLLWASRLAASIADIIMGQTPINSGFTQWPTSSLWYPVNDVVIDLLVTMRVAWILSAAIEDDLAGGGANRFRALIDVAVMRSAILFALNLSIAILSQIPDMAYEWYLMVTIVPFIATLMLTHEHTMITAAGERRSLRKVVVVPRPPLSPNNRSSIATPVTASNAREKFMIILRTAKVAPLLSLTMMDLITPPPADDQIPTADPLDRFVGITRGITRLPTACSTIMNDVE